MSYLMSLVTGFLVHWPRFDLRSIGQRDTERGSCSKYFGFPHVSMGVALTIHPSTSAEVKERVQLYLYSPSGSWWSVLGRTFPLSVLVCR